MQNVLAVNFLCVSSFSSVPGSSLIPFSITQVVVFRSDGSVLLNDMTVNVPHVSGKGHVKCHTPDFSYRGIFLLRQKWKRGI